MFFSVGRLYDCNILADIQLTQSPPPKKYFPLENKIISQSNGTKIFNKAYQTTDNITQGQRSKKTS